MKKWAVALAALLFLASFSLWYVLRRNAAPLEPAAEEYPVFREYLHQTFEPDPIDDFNLKQEYNELNEKWFHNELPKNALVIWVPNLSSYWDWGLTRFANPKSCLNGHKVVNTCASNKMEASRYDPRARFIIMINPECIRADHERETLLHEMVHVHLKWTCPAEAYHERCFREEMHRILVEGALDGVY